jgi:hypothetical protein
MLVESGPVLTIWGDPLERFAGPPGPRVDPIPVAGEPGSALERRLCQVVGLNQNYVSAAGTLYHIQIEDLGPVQDRVTERDVRRVNVIVYANYGEPNARIIHGEDHDFEDLRTHGHNRLIAQKIQELAEEARRTIEDKEQRLVMRIKCLIREYFYTKAEAAKKEFEQANALYPFLFSRAWSELKQERPRAEGPSAPAPPPVPEPVLEPPPEVLYPLDSELRARVLDIERIIKELTTDLEELRARGSADDILLQTCRKLVTRARESLTGHEPTDFTARRLEMTRNSLVTTWKQVRSRLMAS